jgi:hypothetical protein
LAYSIEYQAWWMFPVNYMFPMHIITTTAIRNFNIKLTVVVQSTTAANELGTKLHCKDLEDNWISCTLLPQESELTESSRPCCMCAA